MYLRKNIQNYLQKIKQNSICVCLILQSRSRPFSYFQTILDCYYFHYSLQSNQNKYYRILNIENIQQNQTNHHSLEEQS
jgi:hypothetical protein